MSSASCTAATAGTPPPVTRQDEPEPAFQPMDAGVDPLREGVDEPERLTCLRRAFAEFRTFSDRVMRNSRNGNGSA